MKLCLIFYKCLIILVVFLCSQSTFANNDDNLFDINAQVDFRTMHIWRGTATSYTHTFEPRFEINKDNITTGI